MNTNMIPITTPRGTVLINKNAPKELLDSALYALMSPTPHSFKSFLLNSQYDDEGWDACKMAIEDKLVATPEEKIIAMKILNQHLPIEKAQALLH